MPKRFTTLVALGATLTGSLPASAGQPITGRWLTADGGAVVSIGDCGGRTCGRIVRLLKVPSKGSAIDANNPDPKLKTRPLLGMPVLTGMTASGDGWTANVYDPKRGKTIPVTVSRDGRNLNIKGCRGPFCRTLVWTMSN